MIDQLLRWKQYSTRDSAKAKKILSSNEVKEKISEFLKDMGWNEDSNTGESGSPAEASPYTNRDHV